VLAGTCHGIYAGSIEARVNRYGYAMDVMRQRASADWPIISWPFSATDAVQ
jgi:hypothetical protein